MNFYLARHSSFFCILLALFFFASSVSAFYTFAEQQTLTKCCDQDAAPQSPVEEGECFDCQCLTCSAALISELGKKFNILSTSGEINWFIAVNYPSGSIQLIEYPPEVC